MNPRVTIVDVAREAGVSISSVSAALNGRSGVSEETRERVAEVARRQGWVPSLRGRSLSQQRAFAVGLVLQRPSRIIEVDPFFAGFIGGVESVLEGRGYALVLQLAPDADHVLERYRRLALDHRIDGAFLADVTDGDLRFALLDDLHLPAVAINAEPGHPSIPTVRQDHEPAMAALMEHLVGLGHRRIAHVTGLPGYIHTRHREEAWRAGLKAAGLRPGPVIVGDFSTGCGARAAETLLAAADPPTAVVCANDLTAIGLTARAIELGAMVPEQLSVVGYDGIQLGSYLRPPLTTVTTAPHDLGWAAAESLLDLVDGHPPRDREIAPAALLVRRSTAPRPTRRSRVS